MPKIKASSYGFLTLDANAIKLRGYLRLKSLSAQGTTVKVSKINLDHLAEWTIPLKEAASLLRNLSRDPLQT